MFCCTALADSTGHVPLWFSSWTLLSCISFSPTEAPVTHPTLLPLALACRRSFSLQAFSSSPQTLVHPHARLTASPLHPRSSHTPQALVHPHMHLTGPAQHRQQRRWKRQRRSSCSACLRCTRYALQTWVCLRKPRGARLTLCGAWRRTSRCGVRAPTLISAGLISWCLAGEAQPALRAWHGAVLCRRKEALCLMSGRLGSVLQDVGCGCCV